MERRVLHIPAVFGIQGISPEVFIVLSLPDLLCSFLRANNLLLVLYSFVYSHYGFGVYSLLCSDCNTARDQSSYVISCLLSVSYILLVNLYCI